MKRLIILFSLIWGKTGWTWLLLISKKLKFYKQYVSLQVQINNKIIDLSEFNSKNYKSVKKELKKFEIQKLDTQKKVYLAKLIRLRD